MKKYRFDEIAFNSTEKKKPTEADKDTYLGLEHLDSGCLTVSRFGSDVAPIGEKLVMKKGDVLFGKRRAYQKKVAIAPFDGIFSAHGMVLRPKSNVIDPDFFPLFISSDYFLDAAIKISVGSLSPTINWRDLKDLEFELPDLKEQNRIAGVLNSINRTREAYKKLLFLTDQLVKSQFIEMFGDPQNYGSENTISLGEISEMVSGGTPSSKHPEYFDGDMPFVSTPFLGANYITEKDVTNRISEEGIRNSSTHKIPAYSLLFGNRVGVGKSSINTCEVCTNQDVLSFTNIDPKKYDLLFIKKILDQRQEFFDSQKRGATIKGIPSDLVKKTKIPLIPLETQRTFVGIVQQSDKSKFELERAISELDATYKRIISENLG